jgi:hypothetical protein
LTQKDYILRQIELLGAALIAIRKRIFGGEADVGEIENRLQEVSEKGGMALDLARAASPETLKMLIAPTGEIEPGRCWLLAETLFLDGIHALQVRDEPRARDSLAKAGMLFSLLEPMGAFLVGFPEAAERVREIDELFRDLSRDPSPPPPV